MTDSPLEGKNQVMEALKQLGPLNQRRPNNFLLQMFFDSKVEEIINLFGEGPKVNFKETVGILNRLAPLFWFKMETN